MAGLENELLQFRTEHFGEGEVFVAELLDRIMEVESSQIQLQRETVALERRYQERLVDSLKSEIDDFVAKQRKKANQISAHLDAIEKSHDSKESVALLKRLRSFSSEILVALKQGDLDEARQTVEGFLDAGDDWSIVHTTTPSPLKKAQKVAEQIAKNIEDVYPNPNTLMTKSDNRRNRTLTVRQRIVRRLTQRLKKWIRSQSEKAQFVSQRALASLTKATSNIDRATSSFEKKALRDAVFYQAKVLDELSRLREDLKRGSESMPMESRSVAIRGVVELPAPEDFQVPPEFRNDILEAMESRIPDQYEEAIKRYYETLVK